MAISTNPAADHPGTTAHRPPATSTAARWPCNSLDTELRSHLGYQPDENDYADMRELARRYGCSLPAPYDQHDLPTRTLATAAHRRSRSSAE